MTRSRVAVLAVIVLGALGWWLFRAGQRPETLRPDPPAGGRRDDSIVSNDETLAAPAPARRGEQGSAPVAGPEEAASRQSPAEAPAYRGICVLEDGTPLPGVVFRLVAMEEGEFERPVDVDWASGLDGEFSIHREATALLAHPSATPVLADGGTIVRDPARGVTFRATSDMVRITFRDKSGLAHVRLVNADTGAPVTEVKGLRVSWHIPGGLLRMGFTAEQAPGGWIPVPEGRLPESGPGDKAGIRADLSKVEVEFAEPGFEKGRLPLKDIRGRMTLPVRPVPPDAFGVIGEPQFVEFAMEDFIPDPPWPVTSHLRWMGPEPAPPADEVQGIPASVGKFSLYDLPDGPWELEVAATVPGDMVVRGKKAFEKHGGTVDLGTIELKPGGKVALRVVDSADEPIPQAWAVIVRPDENPDQGRRLDLSQDGRVAVGDLEPGVGHRVVVKGLPRELEQTVVAAADAKPVEFKWTEKLVPCRITILVDGKAVANPDGRTTIPAVVQESPLPRDKGAWKSDGTFEAKLVPGTYRFSVLATPKEGGALALFAGEVTVPSGDAFEARLELQRGGK